MSGMRVVTAVRARPLSTTETTSGAVNILSYDTVTKGIGVTHPSAVGKCGTSASPERVFNYDYNFWSVYKGDPHFSTQEDVFNEIGTPIIDNCLQGMNCSLFAYGQTGSGKTYTMMGSGDSDEDMGLIPRICRSVLAQLTNKDLNIEGSIEKLLSAKVFVSFLEIYNEKIFDLLSSSSGVTSRVREHPQNGAYVENLTKVKAEAYRDILRILNDGKKKRQVASTLMNSESSRSHAVFTIYVVQQILSTTEFERSSKVSLVDLAGSERVNNSGVTGDRLKEASNINKSLSTLGDVINALSEKNAANGNESSFIPYRNSTLTWLLKDSLGGNSKTSMLATISPSDANYGESMSTLRYLERAKLIINKVSINESHWENPQVALLQKQLSELNAKYVALMKLHQSREAEYEATLANIKVDMDGSSSARVEELQRYVSHLENQLGLPQSGPGVPSSEETAEGDAAADQPASNDIESELNRSWPFSDHGNLDLDDLLDKDVLSTELQNAVSEMLTVVCGEAVPAADCGTAAEVFASVLGRHAEPMKEKYQKLLERHKLLEKWYSNEREIVTAKNSQLDDLTNEITTLRRNVFRSQSFMDEPNIWATIKEGEESLHAGERDENPFAGDLSPTRQVLNQNTSGVAIVMHKLENELAEAMISLQNTKRIQEEQLEIHGIEMDALKGELKTAVGKLADMKLERDQMSSTVLEVNNLRASLENDLRSAQKDIRQQNAKFSDRLMSKDSEISQLTEQVSTLQSTVAEVEGNYKKEISVLESHLKAQTKAVVLLKAEKESMKRNLAKELDSTLLDTEATHAALRDELDRTKSQLQISVEELDALKEEREADAVGFLNELDLEELKFSNAKKQWTVDEEKLKSEISYWVAELENVREEASCGIDELRDALMSQSEVHKKYESEKESEIAVLKTWLEEAQADLEELYKAKAAELAMVNDNTLKLKTELESQISEKASRIDTMLENIDSLTKKCNKWDVAYESLKKKLDDSNVKNSELEQELQSEIDRIKEEHAEGMARKDELIAAANLRYDELAREFDEKQTRTDEELLQVRDELSVQLVKYDMLELDEVTEVDALKSEIHKLEETDEAKIKLAEKERDDAMLEVQSLSEAFATFKESKSIEIEGHLKESTSLKNEIDSLNSNIENAENQIIEFKKTQEVYDVEHQAMKLDLEGRVNDLRQNILMLCEELATYKLLLAEEREKLHSVYVSASAAIGEADEVDIFTDGPNREHTLEEKIPLEYDEDSDVDCDAVGAHEETDVVSPPQEQLLDIRNLATVVLEYLQTEKIEIINGKNPTATSSSHSLDSLSMGSETIEGLRIATDSDILKEPTPASDGKSSIEDSLQRQVEVRNLQIRKLEDDKNGIIVRYESTLSDMKNDFDSSASAMEVARSVQECEISQLQEEILSLKNELEQFRERVQNKQPSDVLDASAPATAVSTPIGTTSSANDSKIPAKPKPKKVKKSFWLCTSVAEGDVVDPVTELPPRR